MRVRTVVALSLLFGEGAPSARSNFSVVWTGTEAIVWRGMDGNSGTFYDDGALFTQ